MSFIDDQAPLSYDETIRWTTDLKFSRKLPELDQCGDLLPQQELQTLEMKVFPTCAIINCRPSVSADTGPNTLARTDGKRKAFAYALGLLCSRVPASLASISARVCVPELYRVHAHAPRTSRCDNPARERDLSTTMYQSGR